MTREELIQKIRTIAPEIIKNRHQAELKAVEYDELTKFPELKQILIDLLTSEFHNFLSSLDWVSPRPTTFRVNLKNNQEFYLIFGRRSWIAQVEGKKYYLLNLHEEQRAAEAISRILRYGSKVETGVQSDEELASELPTDEPSDEAPEETPES